MVRPSGLEPPTPTMSRWCSNQLSYGRKDKRNSTHISKGKQAFFFVPYLIDVFLGILGIRCVFCSRIR